MMGCQEVLRCWLLLKFCRAQTRGDEAPGHSCRHHPLLFCAGLDLETPLSYPSRQDHSHQRLCRGNLLWKVSWARRRGCLHLTCQVQRRHVSASQASRPQPTTRSSSPAFPILPPECCCGTQPQTPHASEGFANLWKRPPHIKFSFSMCTIQRHLTNPRCCSTIIAILFRNISISPKGNVVPMATSPFPLVLNPGSHQSALGLPSSGIFGISQKRNGTVCSLW